MLSMDAQLRSHRPPTPDDKYYNGPPPTNGSAGSRKGSPLAGELTFSVAYGHENGSSAANGNGAPPVNGHSNGNGTNGTSNGAPARVSVSCVNCGTLETPLWRRTTDGSPICNACGLYQKSRNMPRPASLSPTTHHPSQSHPHSHSSHPHHNNTSASPHAGGGNPPATHPAAYASSAAAPAVAHPATHPAAYGGPPPPPSSHSPTSPVSAGTQQGTGGVHQGGGTCPGDGRCDGTGGTSACSGCPTWNNSASRERLSAAAAAASAANNTAGTNTDEPASMRQILNPTPPPPPTAAASNAGSPGAGGSAKNGSGGGGQQQRNGNVGIGIGIGDWDSCLGEACLLLMRGCRRDDLMLARGGWPRMWDVDADGGRRPRSDPGQRTLTSAGTGADTDLPFPSLFSLYTSLAYLDANSAFIFSSRYTSPRHPLARRTRTLLHQWRRQRKRAGQDQRAGVRQLRDEHDAAVEEGRCGE
ncbi:hypothetical protein B0H19DRAFT_1251014 [Mycena capillaripes]|nr:hypothetical protein B0H19DRAFT_1251014 [Mycena capillaripes]